MSALATHTLLNGTQDITVGLLEVDADVDAERCVILSRYSFDVLVSSVTVAMSKVVVPFEFTTKNELMVIILDDDGVYNAAIMDGVKAESVKLSEV